MFKRKRNYSSSEDESVPQKRQGALYVEPPQRPINMNTIPNDGNEYIHKTRIESSRLDFNKPRNEARSSSPESNDDSSTNGNLLRGLAAEFAALSNEFSIRRESMKMQIPQPKETIPIEDEIESCLFCLGSAKCLTIYECCPDYDVEAHLPYLRYIIHLSQPQIKKLLKYTFIWYKNIGMDEIISRWVFALMACVIKPISNAQERFLSDYLDDLKMHLPTCDEEESLRVRKLMSIMDNYFVLKLARNDGEYLTMLKRLKR